MSEEKSEVNSGLSEEQLLRIEANRQAALKKLSEKQSATNPTTTENKPLPPSSESTQATAEKPKKALKRNNPYYEYDLTNMVDTRGGFLVDEEAEEEGSKKKKYEPPKLINDLALSINPEENPKCKECGSIELDPIFLTIFNLHVCSKCKEEFPEKFSLITKTEAKEDYLLTDPELKDRDLFPCWKKPNPRKSTWNDMMLFVREQVEEFAFKKWGGEEALDAEFERRQNDKKKRKDKKFRAQLADLRRRTRTSTWEKKRVEHVHDYDEPIEDQETGEMTQTCKSCGFKLSYDEL
ncbi:DNA repair protein [Basidiobolus meristosporus CBS 931.73]|uniref:DNA repair protein RAD14 n=1 Tax=Basidiobolus meristosporus CBS 931.73 TaxID=1314790 RepID=A0A1Y1YIS8_9FUNG|nr:DNA repair protein [Basidiobolus meristosporus CBS 931.73]|eukprot:ORX97931.1 DNA repair protein [Basidiobolus meristosporus CBS 931.73]